MARSSRATDNPATIARRYQVQHLLGRGGMGCVYAVYDSLTGRPLALKQLSDNAGKHALELFEREYHTLASLQHPAIVRVFDYAAPADHAAFYTMELLEGKDLSHCAPMPWREACARLREVASVVAILHARELVHRDLSPKNLWLTPNGQLKFIDFGALTPFGESRALVGTPPFVAPEATRGGAVDQRSDLFALGALAYWLCTGVHAFPARNLYELPSLHAQPPHPPSRIASMRAAAGDAELPAALDELILALLSPDPANRPQRAEELIDRLNLVALGVRERSLPRAAHPTHRARFRGQSRSLPRDCATLDRNRRGGLRRRRLDLAHGHRRSGAAQSGRCLSSARLAVARDDPSGRECDRHRTQRDAERGAMRHPRRARARRNP